MIWCRFGVSIKKTWGELYLPRFLSFGVKPKHPLTSGLGNGTFVSMFYRRRLSESALLLAWVLAALQRRGLQEKVLLQAHEDRMVFPPPSLRDTRNVCGKRSCVASQYIHTGARKYVPKSYLSNNHRSVLLNRCDLAHRCPSYPVLPCGWLTFPGKRLYKFVALPSAAELKVFLNFAGPIAFALLGKVQRRRRFCTDPTAFSVIASHTRAIDMQWSSRNVPHLTAAYGAVGGRVVSCT